MKAKALMVCVVTLLVVMACGGGGGDDPVVEGQTFRQTLEVKAEAGSEYYTLTDLTAKVGSIDNTVQWLTVMTTAYTSESPRIQLAYEENTGEEERQANVIIADVGGNRVILTVKQTAKGSTPDTDYGIDDTHDTPTDRPAYSRQY